MPWFRGVIQRLFRRDRTPATAAETIHRMLVDMTDDEACGDGIDQFSLICRATRAKEVTPTPAESALLDRFLGELPDRDVRILTHFKLDKTYSEIAELMGMDVGEVRRSLVRTFADLRMRMLAGPGPHGGGEPVEVEGSPPVVAAMERVA